MWADYMSKTKHSSGEISPPQGVTMAQVDAASGRVWQEGCGPEITQAFIAGTEPRDMCGGGFEGDMMAGYQEPAMISEQQAMDMSAEAMGNQQDQIVVDPAENDPTVADDTTDVTEPDTLGVQQQQESQRRIDERAQRERARVIQPPVTPRPEPRAVPRPPVDSQPPPPRTDTIPSKDSLSIYR